MQNAALQVPTMCPSELNSFQESFREAVFAMIVWCDWILQRQTWHLGLFFVPRIRGTMPPVAVFTSESLTRHLRFQASVRVRLPVGFS